MIPRVHSEFAQTTADCTGSVRNPLVRAPDFAPNCTLSGFGQLSASAGHYPSLDGGRVQSPMRVLRLFSTRCIQKNAEGQGTSARTTSLMGHERAPQQRATEQRTETVPCAFSPFPSPLHPALVLRPAKAPTLNAARLARASARRAQQQRAAMSRPVQPLAAQLALCATTSPRSSAAKSTGLGPTVILSPAAPGSLPWAALSCRDVRPAMGPLKKGQTCSTRS
ncbi:hypothetical protein SAMN04488093_102638 [Tropicibacter naphthalenivorans]|uniref:Uncharacterized protein n=1 Tax=Tropicibacter naphthalenivorans TaxID=441103 RepID=A0A0P1G3W0_9RHOB|nr:hypothetical protein TRN7648_00980 [Tropicibacter naphthalenivorans]SMC65615.1 hypothetical protein SAMN04488093_102638 [Tropicibacter naphthalenivorans]